MTLNLEDDDRRSGLPRRSEDSERPSTAKSLGIVLAAISLAGSIFVAGYNWRSVAIVEANQDQFVRKDVVQWQQQNVSDRLSEISRQLEDLRSELRAQRRKD